MIRESVFGVTQRGQIVHSYRISNGNGMSVTVLDYGCTLQSVVLSHRGKSIDICLGYDTIQEYEQNDGYLGAIIGRYAGRIPDGILPLGNRLFRLYRNDGENHLHGGRVGFDKAVFRTETTDSSVTLYYDSDDGEEGYPSALSVSVTYQLSDDDILSVICRGISDGLTAWNPTSHAYWNLNGHSSGSVLSHKLQIAADRFVPVDSALIPIDCEHDVSGTPFDFRKTRLISDGFKDQYILERNGYDHSFVLSDGKIEFIGENGIRMLMLTDCRAVQMYTSNFLSERNGKDGAIYHPHDAICLETESRQLFRNQPLPEESVLQPNQPKQHTTTFRFIYE